MKLSSSEIPQADVLEDVFKVVDGISAGAHKFQEIASYIGKVERQGRYYRLAAQLLGLVENTNNYATLTELGVELAQANEETRIAIVRDSFVQTRLFQRLLPFLEREVRLTHATIVSFLNELSEPVGQSMMQRRSSTVLSWLMNFKIIKKKSDYYVFNRTSFLQNGAVKYSSLEEPLLPSSIELSEYQIVKERTGAISKEISFIQNNVAIERANILPT